MGTDEQDSPSFPSPEEVARMAAAQASVSGAGREPKDVLAGEDDTEVFTKGFCHALALELHQAFTEAGRPAEFVYLASKGHEFIASHVLVKSGDAYFDARFGPQSENEVLERWSENSDGKLRPVKHEGWLTHPADGPPGITPSHTCLGFRIEPDYFNSARERAARFISRNRAKFGLTEDVAE
jgi:hypothetical protein